MTEGESFESSLDITGLMPVYAVQEFVDTKEAIISFDMERVDRRLSKDSTDIDAIINQNSLQVQRLCLTTFMRTLNLGGVDVSVRPKTEDLPPIDTEFDKQHMLSIIQTFAGLYITKHGEYAVEALKSDLDPEVSAMHKAILHGLGTFLKDLLRLFSEYDDHFRLNPELIELLPED